ncbi:acyl-CoA dehydrogenase family protein [Zoogloea sp.]|uniref:acyl-CoA dehydrogenase family protein n=1 Tax=Zoogloea sp. TaxID=49181 RepID=UPI00141653A8|nr:MAG: acyl-CoA dehydrogenase [Zoogloea sp.]
MNKPANPLAEALAASLKKFDEVVAEVITPAAGDVDADGSYPRAAFDALGRHGLLGLISSAEVGGLGLSHRAAALAVEKVAQGCTSTAMVLCMHYCATAVIEAFGSIEVRRAIAAGNHVSTLAFSETGSRSHFWAPVGTAAAVEGAIRLDGKKSMITSAGEADSYVWSSRPAAAEGASTLWLVPADAAGLTVVGKFEGLGLRGNASSPITADNVRVADSDRLGADGGGFDIMMGTVVPYFNLMTAAVSLGNMEAALGKAIAHVSATRFEHLGQSIADLPTVRAYLGRARIKVDMVRTLLMDTLDAVEQGRPDTMLRLLEVKAAAAETGTEVTDLAMRVCGGAAFRKSHGVERHFRDARAATVMAPTADVLYDFIGKAVCGMPVFG